MRDEDGGEQACCHYMDRYMILSVKLLMYVAFECVVMKELHYLIILLFVSVCVCVCVCVCVIRTSYSFVAH